MTENEFYEELAKTKNLYVWGIEIWNSGVIRSRFENNLFCPITAIYFSKTGRYIKSSNFSMAASELGIDEEFASSVATAADFPIINLNERETEIKRMLLTTLELKENDNG